MARRTRRIAGGLAEHAVLIKGDPADRGSVGATKIGKHVPGSGGPDAMRMLGGAPPPGSRPRAGTSPTGMPMTSGMKRLTGAMTPRKMASPFTPEQMGQEMIPKPLAPVTSAPAQPAATPPRTPLTSAQPATVQPQTGARQVLAQSLERRPAAPAPAPATPGPSLGGSKLLAAAHGPGVGVGNSAFYGRTDPGFYATGTPTEPNVLSHASQMPTGMNMLRDRIMGIQTDPSQITPLGSEPIDNLERVFKKSWPTQASAALQSPGLSNWDSGAGKFMDSPGNLARGLPEHLQIAPNRPPRPLPEHTPFSPDNPDSSYNRYRSRQDKKAFDLSAANFQRNMVNPDPAIARAHAKLRAERELTPLEKDLLFNLNAGEMAQAARQTGQFGLAGTQAEQATAAKEFEPPTIYNRALGGAIASLPGALLGAGESLTSDMVSSMKDWGTDLMGELRSRLSPPAGTAMAPQASGEGVLSQSPGVGGGDLPPGLGNMERQSRNRKIVTDAQGMAEAVDALPDDLSEEERAELMALLTRTFPNESVDDLFSYSPLGNFFGTGGAWGKDLATLNAKRKKMGLPPIAEPQRVLSPQEKLYQSMQGGGGF